MIRLLRRRFCGAWCFLVTVDLLPVALLRAVAKLFPRPCYFFRRRAGDPVVYPCLNPPDGNPFIELSAEDVAQMLRHPPYPTQSSLDQVLAPVTRVVVSQVRGGQGAPDRTVDDSADIATLRGALQIDERPATFSTCGCGGTDIRLLLQRGELEPDTMEIIHGRLRWHGWPLDEPLFVRPTLLQAWLNDHGCRWDPEDSGVTYA
jgi:hypothetical protein